MFKRNEGTLDRIVRVALGIVLLASGLFWLGGLQGSVLGLLAAGLGVIGLFTGVTGVCILYIPFGISTLEKEKELKVGQTGRPGPQAIGKTRNQQG
jgi:hypothetical protein